MIATFPASSGDIAVRVSGVGLGEARSRVISSEVDRLFGRCRNCCRSRCSMRSTEVLPCNLLCRSPRSDEQLNIAPSDPRKNDSMTAEDSRLQGSLPVELSGVRVLLDKVPRNLLPRRKPHVVKLGKMLHDALESLESSRTTDPAGMESDGDVGGLSLEAFLANCAGACSKSAASCEGVECDAREGINNVLCEGVVTSQLSKPHLPRRISLPSRREEALNSPCSHCFIVVQRVGHDQKTLARSSGTSDPVGQILRIVVAKVEELMTVPRDQFSVPLFVTQTTRRLTQVPFRPSPREEQSEHWDGRRTNLRCFRQKCFQLVN